MKKQGELHEGATLLLEAVDGHRATLGDNHPRTLSSIHNLAVVVEKTGKLDNAEAFYGRALDGRRATLGDAHADTRQTRKKLNNFLQKQAPKTLGAQI